MACRLACGMLIGVVAAALLAVPEARSSETGLAKAGPGASVVAGRMVCSDKCQRLLDVANGIKDCPKCGSEKCNAMHAGCQACAGRLGICEVCGKAMPPATRPATAPAPSKPS